MAAGMMNGTSAFGRDCEFSPMPDSSRSTSVAPALRRGGRSSLGHGHPRSLRSFEAFGDPMSLQSPGPSRCR